MCKEETSDYALFFYSKQFKGTKHIELEEV